jgi:hypothetical protein
MPSNDNLEGIQQWEKYSKKTPFGGSLLALPSSDKIAAAEKVIR